MSAPGSELGIIEQVKKYENYVTTLQHVLGVVLSYSVASQSVSGLGAFSTQITRVDNASDMVSFNVSPYAGSISLLSTDLTNVCSGPLLSNLDHLLTSTYQ